MPAFTNLERTTIRRALGYQTRFFQTDSTLENALDAVDSETANGDATPYDAVVELLSKISTVEVAITAALPRLKASKVGTIDISAPVEIATLKVEGRRAVAALAAFLGVEVRFDVFGSGSPSGAGGAVNNELVIG